MRLEDLQQVNLSAGRPSSTMTNKQWQDRFAVMRLIVAPAKHSKMKSTKGSTSNPSLANDGVEPQWLRYRTYINSVLKEIRAGNEDYCYYIYQITDLLRYEHDTLRTEYICDQPGKPGFFRVWLEKGN